ncbi:hypothetical protein EFK22_12765 [Lactococcus lactis subsp. lactis]|uniref:Uncharacterized protein n=1 Tax=Lactococcus cremoris subsp. cremoris GE214 TaxID=1415168 RepID=A0A084A6X3_LACLC|nr:hypothetical protein U725_02810 [Lactococcus cremoris subsp. cremoris GE214]MCT0030944.1 hypothetical protein [Lactococcus lactis subsp. lactis]MCT0501856.1 hypothetical protein [Lactococcus cremoris]MCT3089254.1 hypothetical protein [Lactococcus lactis]MCT0049528.1 hypothetical protein [Lactococcus lactis subsp. lactis]
MKNKRVPNRIKATIYSEGRIAIQATWGFGCEVNAGGAVAQIHNQNVPERISSAARYLHCEELDILEAIDDPGKVIETTTVIKTKGDI